MTALSLLAEDLKLSTNERHFALAMLRSTPTAAKGEETLIPVGDLVAAVQDGPKSFRSINKVVDDLMKPKSTATTSGVQLSFPMMTSYAWVDGSSFLRYQLNQTFCLRLCQLAKSRQVEPF